MSGGFVKRAFAPHRSRHKEVHSHLRRFIPSRTYLVFVSSIQAPFPLLILLLLLANGCTAPPTQPDSTHPIPSRPIPSHLVLFLSVLTGPVQLARGRGQGRGGHHRRSGRGGAAPQAGKPFLQKHCCCRHKGAFLMCYMTLLSAVAPKGGVFDRPPCDSRENLFM